MTVIIAHANLPAHDFAPSIVNDAPNAKILLDAGTPAFFQGEAQRTAQYHNTGPGMTLRISRHKNLVRSCELKMRASFPNKKVSAFWSTTVSLKVSLQGVPAQKIVKATISGQPSALTDAERQAHLAAFDSAFAAFIERIDQAPDYPSSDRFPDSDLLDIRRALIEQVTDLFAKKDHQKERKVQALDDRLRLLNELPDGTPLKVRTSTYSRSWQIGMKHGPITKDRAAHACLLKPEIFSSEELRSSSISAHQLLPMMAAAQIAAQAASDDHLFDFHHPVKVYAPNGLPLNEEMPLHKSFRETEDLKKRRRNAPKIWVQTGFQNLSRGYVITLSGTGRAIEHVSNTNKVFMSGKMGPHPHPSYGDDSTTPIRTIYSNPKSGVRDALTPFSLPAGLLVVNEEIADLLREHELGRNTLEPISIHDPQERAIPGGWHHLVLREEISAVRFEQLHPDHRRSLTRRAVKPYEIPVDPKAPGALDIWTDPQLMPQGVFLSGKLHSALKKANALPRMIFKPCETI